MDQTHCRRLKPRKVHQARNKTEKKIEKRENNEQEQVQQDCQIHENGENETRSEKLAISDSLHGPSASRIGKPPHKAKVNLTGTPRHTQANSD
jgi:hypothetical protein